MRELDTALAIAKTVLPHHDAQSACMIVGAAIAGIRGLKISNIRIGALYDVNSGSMAGGWGLSGVNHREGKIYFADAAVDDDGGFNGHTWIEPEPETVIDLMHGVEDGERRDWEGGLLARAYIPRPKLERAVKAFWRAQMRQAHALGRKASAHDPS